MPDIEAEEENSSLKKSSSKLSLVSEEVNINDLEEWMMMTSKLLTWSQRKLQTIEITVWR